MNKGQELKTFTLKNLEYHSMFAERKATEIMKNYNGFGNEELPSLIRKSLTKIYSFAEAAAFEHDDYWGLVEQGIFKPTKENFITSNKRLGNNIKKCAKLRYNWYNPKRYRGYLRAVTAQKMCNKFGFESFIK